MTAAIVEHLITVLLLVYVLFGLMNAVVTLDMVEQAAAGITLVGPDADQAKQARFARTVRVAMHLGTFALWPLFVYLEALRLIRSMRGPR